MTNLKDQLQLRYFRTSRKLSKQADVAATKLYEANPVLANQIAVKVSQFFVKAFRFNTAMSKLERRIKKSR